jgi:hypothetical protein
MDSDHHPGLPVSARRFPVTLMNAQEPAPAAPSQALTKVETRIVLVDGGHRQGTSVPGLRENNFQITEDGIGRPFLI